MTLNILDYLEFSGNTFPDKIAFADDKKSITFCDLILQAKSIGTDLADNLNSQIRQPVLVFVERNIESIISFMGVVYSGNFYVPIDSKMPQERIKLIFDTLNPVAGIYTTDFELKILDSIGYTGLKLHFENAIVQEINERKLHGIRNSIIDIDPLYAIFTSGSTGVPKGVVISHKSVIDLAEWLVETFEFTENDILGNQTPFYFDGSVKDIYITLKTGATMQIISKKYFTFPALLTDLLNEKKVTSILWATSAVTLIGNSNILEEKEIKYINKVFFAGEAMPAKQLNVWRKHLPTAKYINLYGPTEATVDSTYFIVDRDFKDNEFIPIGFPCKNMEIMVLNKENQLVRGEEAGELCVRGTALAMGYYNDTAKTKEVFVQNPMHNNYEDKVYRTGDIVRYNERGELIFVSRQDFQIKHMGNRIELGEIEVAVNSLDKVTGAACIYDLDRQKIVLFYTTNNEHELDIINLVKTKIPKYMFPNVIIQLKELPYNLNGKVDRLKLTEHYLNAKNK